MGCLSVVTILAACGGGGGGSTPQTPPAQTPDPTPSPTPDPDPTPDPTPDPDPDPTPDPDPPPACDPAPAPGTPAVFQSAPAGGGTLSPDGTLATFIGSTDVGIRSTIAVTQGPSSFYYFEAKRDASAFGVYVGVVGSVPVTPPVSATADSLIAGASIATTIDSSGSQTFDQVGNEDVLGFAVDYRSKHPIVYIIGSANTPGTSCPGLSGAVPCVFVRRQLATAVGTPGTLYIYAHGFGDGASDGATMEINTGADLVNKPFAYSEAGIRKALRTRFYQSDYGFNAQWPTSTGPAAGPSLTRTGNTWVVLRKNDTTPFRSNLAVSVCPAEAATAIRWRDESDTLHGTGSTLALSALNALTVGEHTLFAGVTDATTGRYTELRYRLTIDAEASNLDDDGDGFNYVQEKTAGTDPANPDTDGDGLSDAVEAGFSFNPALADTDGDGIRDGHEFANDPTGTLPQRLSLLKETGAAATSNGIVLSDDGFAAAFTSDVNPDCLQGVAPYDDPVYSTPGNEICQKRAVRTNGGVKPGEFRYFETRRLFGPENIGHGVITRLGQIDPYCCYEGGVFSVNPPHPLTPPSIAFNSVGGMFVRLVNYPNGTPYTYDVDASQTEYYGFAVDYTNPVGDPIIYFVGRNAGGTMTVSEGFPVTGFGGTDVIPMLYGHPLSDTDPRSSINLGLRQFHYNLDDVRTILGDLDHQNANLANFRPGVGIHRRP